MANNVVANKNFRWIAKDIDSTLVLRVGPKRNSKDTKVFNVLDVLETTGDMLDVETANIDDLMNLLVLGIVRFVNIIDPTDIIDIPFRNLYMLYKNANILEDGKEGYTLSFKELDVFSVIDEEIRDDFVIASSVIRDIPEDLLAVMKIAWEFGSYGSHQQFEAMSRITLINHQRLTRDIKEVKFGK